MPLWEHLDDLRKGLIRCLLYLVGGFSITYGFSETLLKFLERPLLKVLPPNEQHLYFTGITDKFFVYVQVSFFAALALVSPFLFYEIWKFVSPGLYRKEQKYFLPFTILGTVSFLVGLAFAYFVILPYGYHFLIQFGSPEEKAIITLTEYFSLTFRLMMGIALIFEVPLIILLLARFGIVNAAFLSKNRRYAMLLSAVIAAVITPTPDAFTMLLVMVPLYLLYEISIVGVRIFVKHGT